MPRPLRVKYVSAGVSDGLIEMSNTDISDLIVPIVLSKVMSGESGGGSFNTSLLINTGNVNFTTIGTALDTSTPAEGTHPATATTVSTYVFKQENVAETTTSISPRPLCYEVVGDITKVREMTVSEIKSDIIALVVDTMINGGQGGYYLDLTSNGAPVTGTWVSVTTLNDTYYVGSTLTTESYTLWRRTTGDSVGTIRPVKQSVVSGETKITEMTDADVEALAIIVKDYIYNTGIGKYALSITAPVSGTWINRGAFVNKVNNLQDDPYVGAYVGSFTGTYSLSNPPIYSGTFQQAFSGTFGPTNYLLYFNVPFTKEFTKDYTQGYTNTFTNFFGVGNYSQEYTNFFSFPYTLDYTGVYSNVYSPTFAQTFTKAVYTLNYTELFSRVFSNTFIGSYAGNTYSADIYTILYTTIPYSRDYNTAYSRNYLGSFSGPYTRGYTSNAVAYTMDYTNVYSNVYSRVYTGLFTGYTRDFAASLTWSRTFNAFYSSIPTFSSDLTISYQKEISFSSENILSFSRTLSETNYTRVFLRTFSGVSYTAVFQEGYTGAYTNTYSSYVTKNYTYPYSGLLYFNGWTGTSYTYYNTAPTVFTNVKGSFFIANIYFSSAEWTGPKSYTGTFSRYFSATFAGFTGKNYAGGYESSFTRQLSFSAGTINYYTPIGFYTGAISYNNYSKQYTPGLDNRLTFTDDQIFSGIYTGAWTNSYIGGSFTATFSSTYQNIFIGPLYSHPLGYGVYSSDWTRDYALTYTLVYTNRDGEYTNSFTATYIPTIAGAVQYSSFYTGVTTYNIYTRVFGTYSRDYAGTGYSTSYSAGEVYSSALKTYTNERSLIYTSGGINYTTNPTYGATFTGAYTTFINYSRVYSLSFVGTGVYSSAIYTASFSSDAVYSRANYTRTFTRTIGYTRTFTPTGLPTFSEFTRALFYAGNAYTLSFSSPRAYSLEYVSDYTTVRFFTSPVYTSSVDPTEQGYSGPSGFYTNLASYGGSYARWTGAYSRVYSSTSYISTFTSETSAFTSVWSRSYSTWSRLFTGQYTNSFATGFASSGTYTGLLLYTTNYTSTYTSNQSFTLTYSNAFTSNTIRTFTKSNFYTGSYTNSFLFQFFLGWSRTGPFVGTYASNTPLSYTGSPLAYTREFNTSYASTVTYMRVDIGASFVAQSSYSRDFVNTSFGTKVFTISYTSDTPGGTQYYSTYGGFYTANYTEQAIRAFTRSVSAVYTSNYGSYSITINQDYTQSLTSYSQPFTNDFTRAFFTSPTAFTQDYTFDYTKLYSREYTSNAVEYNTTYTTVGSWTLDYTMTYTNAYGSTQFFSKLYTPNFNTSYTQTFSGSYTNTPEFISYLGNFTPLVDTFTVTYSGAFTANLNYTQGYGIAQYTASLTWAGYTSNLIYTRAYTTNFSQTYSSPFTNTFTNIFSKNYSANYTNFFTTDGFSNAYSRTVFVLRFTGAYTNFFSGSYTEGFSGAYSLQYTNFFNNTFTGSYSGLTVLNTTSSTTYTLWVRVA
jgi:hypothetical protein